LIASSNDPLETMLPPVSVWFREAFGDPTPPQRMGWPVIASGRSTLIFAPTGSGKTLAAFLACLDHLWRVPRTTKGARILYVSPLKALNQDVARNLEFPLSGILAKSGQLGTPLTPLRAAVRTGDTPTSERQKLIRKPPDILITTPESLHLMLTSRARETLRSVSHVIVDEIHALCPNKRGVFLAILLERLEAINPKSFVRIGLSATQRPLEEVARYLGGQRRISGEEGSVRFEPRPVTIVDAGQRKKIDLQVSLPSPTVIPQAAGTIWPAIEQRLFGLIRAHKSTIVFTNNRRVAERLTAHLNEVAVSDFEASGSENGEAVENGQLARAHHGSLSLDRRRSTEDLLKAGHLPAVVATSSLELGIDMGAVDLVCQVESPGGVARGLQRVGRAGHLVGQTSKGRLIAKTAGDLLESAALARAMLQGNVEVLRVPTNCLDVLAQQVIACVAVDRWEVTELFDLIRGAYPYRGMTASAFEAVLKLSSGRFHLEALRDLRPRISWDRVHGKLHPLPGSSQLALIGGGTIPDTGQYPLYLGEDGPKLGELDEEFVLERRVGETFMFGTSTWRIEKIDPHRVIVSSAEGRSAFVPFWRGESVGRTPELGASVGELCRELERRREDPAVIEWLETDYHLDRRSAEHLRDFVVRQVRQAGAVPDDRTILVETFRDPSGEMGLVVLSPFGSKFHHALKLAMQGRLRERLGIDLACLHGSEGLLFRVPQGDAPIVDLFEGLTPERAEELIRSELGESALFGLRFRQNAGRALLMPRPDPAKRSPLWLQRLRAKDMLQAVRRFPDFPIVVETYRECLEDDLDLPQLTKVLERLRDGTIRVVTHRGENPSPFASTLIFRFSLAYLYEWDEPKRGDVARRGPEIDAELLDGLLSPEIYALWLDAAAIGRVESRLRGVGKPPRTTDEMAEWLLRLGDLAPSELAGPMAAFISELELSGRAARISLDGTKEPARWISAEDLDRYQRAFAGSRLSARPGSSGNGRKNDGYAESPAATSTPCAQIDKERDAALESIVIRYLQTRALVVLDDLIARYPIDPAQGTDLLERLSEHGGLIRLHSGADGEARYADKRNLDEVRRLSIALKRRESVAVTPEIYADFLVRRHRVHPDLRREGSAAVGLALEQLQGFAATAELWESELLPRRIRDFRPAWLDEAFALGLWRWRAADDGRGEPRVAILPSDFSGNWAKPEQDGDGASLSEDAGLILEHLQRRGADFVADLSRETRLSPSKVRESLDELVHRGLVTNDRFDPLRPAARAMVEALSRASDPSSRAATRARPRLGSSRRLATVRPEGRWSLLRSSEQDAETSALAWASVLFERYGILTRETVALDPWAPPWRELAPWLSQSELRGEVRRGYFVEGLSGVQYALPDAADELARLAGQTSPDPKPVLLATLDPANVYGSGAPLDIPLLEGGTARLNRSASNFIVLIAGRPVLIIEAAGKRLTGLASASESDLRAALDLVPTLAGPSRRVLKVETYNNAATLASPVVPWLSEIGFVRDHPGMAFYAGW
jgi:ATP-dependent helicase Lhr and Lhr-like helicase